VRCGTSIKSRQRIGKLDVSDNESGSLKVGRQIADLIDSIFLCLDFIIWTMRAVRICSWIAVAFGVFVSYFE
jgi:hypothetical protein